MIKLEFPADRLDIAAVFGRALIDYAQGGGELRNGLNGDNFRRSGVPYSNATLSPEELEAAAAEEAARGYEGEEALARATSAGKSADSATGLDGHAEHTTHGSAGAHASGGEPTVDINGLEFNGLYCGVATEPFYGTGPRKGQWKKRRGVSDEEYDRWYAETKARAVMKAGPNAETGTDVASSNLSPQDEEPTNTAAAFGAETTTAEPAPATPGEFMGWTSERQAAGLLTQADIEHVYAENGIAVTDLFGAHAPEVIAGRIATLHGHMVALIASRGNA